MARSRGAQGVWKAETLLVGTVGSLGAQGVATAKILVRTLGAKRVATGRAVSFLLLPPPALLTGEKKVPNIMGRG